MTKIRRGLRLSLNITALVLCVIALFATIWIIIPAPFFEIWLISVLSSEWSFGFGALAFVGLVLSLSLRVYGKSKLFPLSLILGGLAILISFYPLVSVWNVAGDEKVELSFAQYAKGFWSDSNFAFAAKPEHKTYTYAEFEGEQLRLDAYLPDEKDANGAGVIVVHGGSWRGGAKSDFPAWNRWLTKQGYAVFDIDYRLTQPNWQTATGDVKCAVIWVKQNAAKFGVSPEKLVLLGRSAGAHLALLAAYTENDSDFVSSCPNGQFDSNVKAVISFYAPTDLFWDYNNPSNERVLNGPVTLENFLGGSPYQSSEIRERYAKASPVSHVSAQTPPTLLFHGGKDQLVFEQNLIFLDKRLKDENVRHKSIVIGYAQHGFDFNFNGWGAQIARGVMLDFLHQNS
ncbi:MAG: alpha/beta hydrolase, partial [Pyrinomonadaceae bacterium]|nr:alpha/beta hydrolase [Pyrinomonadaceae bacterium]